MPSRAEAVQSLLDLFANPSYLEIGVNRGTTFHALRCSKKVAVDPEFLFNADEAAALHPEAIYHPVTSDEYFSTIIGSSERFQVIYIDGLHTSEQTIRDILNAIHFLTDDGVILIDDVKPNSYLASLPNRENFFKVQKFLNSADQSWMGDVYRVVYFIETFLQQWSYHTIADNHGQTVMWRGARQTIPERTIADVGSKTFEQLVLELPILKLAPFNKIIEAIALTRSPMP